MSLPPPTVGPVALGDVFSLGPQPIASDFIKPTTLPLPPPDVLPVGSGEGFSVGMPPVPGSYITGVEMPLPAPSAAPGFQVGGFDMNSPETAASYIRDMPPAAPPPDPGAPLGALSCIPGWSGNAAGTCAPTTPPTPRSGLAPARPVASAAPVPPTAIPQPVRAAAAVAAAPTAVAAPSAGVASLPLIVREASGGKEGEIERMFRSVAWEAMKEYGFQMTRENGTAAHVLNVRFDKKTAPAEAGPATIDWQLLDPQGKVVDAYRQQLMLFPGLYDPKLVPAISDLVEDALRRAAGSVKSRG